MSGYWADNGAKRRRVDIETLQRLAGEGKPLLEIARIMGFHDWTISKVSKRAGVEIVDVVRRHDGKRGGGRYPKHIEANTTPPPRPSMYALAEFDPVIARALAVRLGA